MLPMNPSRFETFEKGLALMQFMGIICRRTIVFLSLEPKGNHFINDITNQWIKSINILSSAI